MWTKTILCAIMENERGDLMSLYMINCSPFFLKYYGTHTHDCFELILNLEGEGIMTIGDQQFPFYPGSVHIVPKNTPHIKDSCDQFKDIYFLTDTLSMATHSIDESRPIVFSDDADKTLEKLMHMMLYRYLQGNKNDSVLESMYELAISIIEEAAVKADVCPVVDKIIRQLTLSFNDPLLSMENVLNATGYNKDHIRRIFIKETGMTPKGYLTTLRITQAKKLLKRQKETHTPINDIGALCGYYDPQYFSRIFKREVGLTPMEYAKKHSRE